MWSNGTTTAMPMHVRGSGMEDVEATGTSLSLKRAVGRPVWESSPLSQETVKYTCAVLLHSALPQNKNVLESMYCMS